LSSTALRNFLASADVSTFLTMSLVFLHATFRCS
jgi:hypothetical protein